jgi:hypothetical protein
VAREVARYLDDDLRTALAGDDPADAGAARVTGPGGYPRDPGRDDDGHR